MAKVLKASQVYDELKREISASPLKGLTLASVRIGEDYSSRVYFSQQEKLARSLAINYQAVSLAGDISLGELARNIEGLNQNKDITGIVINKPFPSRWREEDVFSLVAAQKDIEGMNPYNLGLLFTGRPKFISPTVRSVMKFIDLAGVDLYGKQVTIVGSSILIGKPLTLLLVNSFATVNLTHIATYESGQLPSYVKKGDLVISSVGKPGLIKGEWIKEGAIVIDVGIGEKDGKLCGDVEFDEAQARAAFITPVPGGVGKLTTLFLFQNLLKAAKEARP